MDDPVGKLLAWPYTSDDQVLLRSSLCEITVADLRHDRRVRGYLWEALRHAVEIIEQFVPVDALGYESDKVDGESQPWPLRDEYLHNMRAALAEVPHEHVSAQEHRTE